MTTITKYTDTEIADELAAWLWRDRNTAPPVAGVADDDEQPDLYDLVECLMAQRAGVTGTCRHCGRAITRYGTGRWVDPEAGYDDADGDGVWRETCDAHDTFEADHEPVEGSSDV